ncbi:MAG: hypothetical protein LH630_10345 [Actinomycetia bacterium]|nr:hypothetical protein [Actinomycetes bacterium]
MIDQRSLTRTHGAALRNGGIALLDRTRAGGTMGPPESTPPIDPEIVDMAEAPHRQESLDRGH